MTRKTNHLVRPVTADDHGQGPENAPVTLVEYGDYECPYCGRAYPIVKRIQERLGNRLRFVFRNFPLAEIHPNATVAAELAEAAALQGKFWEMHDMLYEHQSALGPTNLRGYAKKLDLDLNALDEALRGGEPSTRVRTDFMSAVRSGANGTPPSSSTANASTATGATRKPSWRR
jgi:protein-disulfide isomerase